MHPFDPDTPAADDDPRDALEREQVTRLVGRFRQYALAIDPDVALRKDALADACELSSFDLVAAGRTFEELSDDERRAILADNYEYCVERNRVILAGLEEDA